LGHLSLKLAKARAVHVADLPRRRPLGCGSLGLHERLSFSSSGLPWRFVAHDGVEDSEQSTQASDEDDLLDLW